MKYSIAPLLTGVRNPDQGIMTYQQGYGKPICCPYTRCSSGAKDAPYSSIPVWTKTRSWNPQGSPTRPASP